MYQKIEFKNIKKIQHAHLLSAEHRLLILHAASMGVHLCNLFPESNVLPATAIFYDTSHADLFASERAGGGGGQGLGRDAVWKRILSADSLPAP